ncbi:MAG: RES family NAD+ phosphorylase [Longimicrobiales bacterium]
MPVLCCACTISLAYLESLVHINLAGPMPRNRYRVEIEIPDTVWSARRVAHVHAAAFPKDWDAHPAAKGSLDYGAQWLKAVKAAVLVVPSIVIPEEDNILVNPIHPDAAKLHVLNVTRVEYDHRLFAGFGSRT